jgi:peptide deformylase
VSVRPIVLLGDPRLRLRGEPVDSFGRFLHNLLDDLTHTMRDAPGVGLAAPQIGEAVRIVVVDVTEHPRATSSNGLIVLVDPSVTKAEGSEVAREGCLSIPDLTANVRRATDITVVGRTSSGDPRRLESEGFEARCLLHEIDHLDGILFLDRVDSLTADVFQRKRYQE